MGYDHDGPVSIPCTARFSSSLHRPDGIWVPLSLLLKGHKQLFPPAQSGKGIKLTAAHLSCAEVKKGGAISPFSPYIFME
jgi:hypothetical protein